MSVKNRKRSFERLRLMAVFAMLAVIMFVSDILMELLPNVHIVGVLTVIYTAVYRYKALIPIYIYVFLNGLFSGFGIWWLAYLYVWALLWGAVMLVPRKLTFRVRTFIYVAIVTLHGLAFGLLYLPVQMIYSSDLHYLLSWLAVGFVTADIYHAVGNCVFGILLIPTLYLLLMRLESRSGRE